jgi:hypothetical protein
MSWSKWESDYARGCNRSSLRIPRGLTTVRFSTFTWTWTVIGTQAVRVLRRIRVWTVTLSEGNVSISSHSPTYSRDRVFAGGMAIDDTLYVVLEAPLYGDEEIINFVPLIEDLGRILILPYSLSTVLLC